jgi:hypothetical protein
MPRSTKKGDSKRYDISRTSHGLFFFAMFNSYSSVDFCFKINKHYFNSLNMSEIIKLSSNKSISALLTFFLLVTGCQQDEGPTERDRVIGLLTGVTEKHWVIDASNVDGRELVLSICDSSYVLLMKSDFTWKEIHLNLQCYQSGQGTWSLNEENDVISIRYVNPGSGTYEERHFEIEELSEEFFAYQIAENNRLKYVRMRRLN